MTIKCSVCQLPTEKRAAIDATLREKASFQSISQRTGVSRSSLWRHSRHLDGNKPAEPPQNAVVLAPPAKNPAVTPKSGIQHGEITEASIREFEENRQTALERLEWCFSEAAEVVEAAKQPVIFKKPDGSTVEIPGSLQARVSGIREARESVKTQAELLGLMGGRDIFSGVRAVAVLLSPKCEDLEPEIEPEKPAIDITPEDEDDDSK